LSIRNYYKSANINKSIFIVSCLVALGTGCSSNRGGSTNSRYYSGYQPNNSGYGISATESSQGAQTAGPTRQRAARSGQGAAPAQSSGGNQTAQGGSELMNGNEVSIPLYEEKVNVGKQEVDAGTVHVKKFVRTETVNQPVELRRETVTIDRVPAGSSQPQSSSQSTSAGFAQSSGQSAAQDQGKAFQEQEITIQLHREEPMIQTQIVESGRIVAQKQSQSEQRSVQHQVRKEEVSVDKGNAQGVKISENLRAAAGPGEQSRGSASSAPSEGAASSPQGSSSSALSSGPITDLKTLNQVTDTSSLSGRDVRLSDAKVQEVISPSLIAVGDESASQVYVHLQQPLANLSQGDKVKLNGVVKESSATSSVAASLDNQSSEKLKSKPFFIEAQSAQKSSE
jgi:stress response protein YsnF